MTDNGVRSSWLASAVNSNWRRRASSTGATAIMPMTSTPKKTATNIIGPRINSPASKTVTTWRGSARFWPAKIVPPCHGCGTSRKDPSEVVTERGCPE